MDEMSKRLLDAIIESIPDMIFVKDAKTLSFERFNRAGEELLGWSREELLGKTDHDFYPKEQADFFHKMDRKALREGTLVDVEAEPIQTRGKGLRWLRTKKVPVLDDEGNPQHLLGISEDVTERKLAEERANALERALRAVIAHVPVAIITWTLDLRIVSWNPGAERLYGWEAEEAIDREVDILIPEAEQQDFAKTQARVLEGESLPPADVYRMRRHFQVEVEEQLFVIRDSEGRPARLGCVARDLSTMARLQRATEVLGGAKGDGDPQAMGRSAAMDRINGTLDAVAREPNATVLLLGETGVGKSWLSRRIHARSPRVAKPFLEINCASLGPQLAESELFGHERGAFTGATMQKRGLVEAADGGTLFLDEVGELPGGAQAQLLTFLDTRSFRRVGGTRLLSADVRIIAATNLDLEVAMQKGNFRRDLYYRLSVVPIDIPPLRDRREDIPELAKSMLTDLLAQRSRGRNRAMLRKSALRALQRYEWPGNLRELRNVLERVIILNGGAPVEVDHLPAELRRTGTRVADPSKATLEQVEREHIIRVLDAVNGNRTRAAEVLGIGRSTLKRKLAELRAETSQGQS